MFFNIFMLCFLNKSFKDQFSEINSFVPDGNKFFNQVKNGDFL
jgi:hypothetical protein